MRAESMPDDTTGSPSGAIGPVLSVGLIGFMGAGKTHVGRIVADRLGWGFVDLDGVLAERHGRPASALLEAVGEEEFRRLEHEALAAVSEGVPRVVATGGGVVVTPACRELLRRRFLTVYLDSPWAVLAERTRHGAGRPLWDDRVQDRLAERLPWYRAADVTVDGARPAADVAAEIARAVARREVVVAPPGRPITRAVLDLLDWDGLADALGEGPAVLVTEATVGPLWASRLRERVPALRGVQTVVLPAGESAKGVGGWERCIDGLLAAGLDRATTVVALGGGALGDVAGFAAATALRGVPWVVLPTTLLAMVDSSIGGKVAIDHASGKNLVGAFHAPRLVWAALPALSTLPAEELRAGLAEVVKTAVVADAGLLAFVEEHRAPLLAGDPSVVFPVVERCLRAKARLVELDPDDTGLRALLNGGHTVGHAVEHVTRCRHGEAVAIGLVAETRYAVRIGFCRESALPDRLEHLLAALGLQTRLPDVDQGLLAAAMHLDKKRTGDTLVLPLPVEAGRASLARIPLAATAELLSR
jgi:shikimate kinase/3-dehydroquinate synthase